MAKVGEMKRMIEVMMEEVETIDRSSQVTEELYTKLE